MERGARSVYGEFTQQLEKAEKAPEDGGMRANQMVMTDIDCPNCGRKMGIRTATTGVFLGALATRCRRKSVARPPLTWCRKTKCSIY
ncbi:hypothetical protein ACLK2C_06810 [Escherichia coli]